MATRTASRGSATAEVVIDYADLPAGRVAAGRRAAFGTRPRRAGRPASVENGQRAVRARPRRPRTTGPGTASRSPPATEPTTARSASVPRAGRSHPHADLHARPAARSTTSSAAAGTAYAAVDRAHAHRRPAARRARRCDSAAVAGFRWVDARPDAVQRAIALTSSSPPARGRRLRRGDGRPGATTPPAAGCPAGCKRTRTLVTAQVLDRPATAAMPGSRTSRRSDGDAEKSSALAAQRACGSRSRSRRRRGSRRLRGTAPAWTSTSSSAARHKGLGERVPRRFLEALAGHEPIAHGPRQRPAGAGPAADRPDAQPVRRRG